MKKGLLFLATFALAVMFSACGGENDNGNGGEAEVAVNVTVKSQDGALLNQASVHIGDVSGLTDEDGETQLQVISSSDETIVQVTQDGFVNQAVVAIIEDDTNIQVIMLPVKEKIIVEAIENAQVIQGSTLNAQISLPANALVSADGQPAEGNVTLNLTPWDIQNTDISAMLGNGQALDANNQRVELISAGMMSVSFYDAEGNYLQLAEGATAQIQMDLPYDSINNIPLGIGSEIPLWHFDEERGLWIEEGVGQVVASAMSPVGLAVQAEVPHFSTWNWDFKFDNPGSVDVRCENADGSPTGCDVVAEIVLDDGSKFTKSNFVPSEGLTVINMPSSGTIVWNASKSGLIGQTTSGTTGAVIITLDTPTTDNFVQCNIDGVASACTVTVSADGNEPLDFSVPASGARIQTTFDNPALVSWDARSFDLIEADKIVYYTGVTSSNAGDDVNISLDTRIEKGSIANTIRVGCVNDEIDSDAVACDIAVFGPYEGPAYGTFQNVQIGSFVTVNIPDDLEADDRIYINAEGKLANDTYDGTGGGRNVRYGDLTDGEEVVVTLYLAV
jgi:hypothetical protein